MLRAKDLARDGIDPGQAKFQPLLGALQGNILKPHGRAHAVYLFLRFKRGARVKARAWIGDLATPRIMSARQQLQEAAAHHKGKGPGHTLVNLFLSAKGYQALGGGLALPADPRFRAGMKRSRAILRDPASAAWEKGYRGDIHAAMLLADANKPKLERLVKEIRKELRAFGQVLAVEKGRMWRNHAGHAVEHFGYVDGRSQPLFLRPDMDRAKKKPTGDGITRWNPSAPLNLVLARDPNVPRGPAFGSYAVFRKLEQNVRAFKTLEKKLARKLGLKKKLAELAGALAVGRFEDGTPVARSQSGAVRMNAPIPNNFTYVRDGAGGRCPFQAHIRAVNPRTDAARAHRIARRGIPYGNRVTPPAIEQPPKDMPTRGVGLLFLCFQRNIGTQFEHVQRAANAGRRGAMDPIVGQGRPAGASLWPKDWGQPPGTPFDFRASIKANGTVVKKGVVTLKGGEYFFAPSLPFLRSL